MGTKSGRVSRKKKNRGGERLKEWHLKKKLGLLPPKQPENTIGHFTNDVLYSEQPENESRAPNINSLLPTPETETRESSSRPIDYALPSEQPESTTGVSTTESPTSPESANCSSTFAHLPELASEESNHDTSTGSPRPAAGAVSDARRPPFYASQGSSCQQDIELKIPKTLRQGCPATKTAMMKDHTYFSTQRSANRGPKLGKTFKVYSRSPIAKVRKPSVQSTASMVSKSTVFLCPVVNRESSSGENVNRVPTLSDLAIANVLKKVIGNSARPGSHQVVKHANVMPVCGVRPPNLVKRVVVFPARLANKEGIQQVAATLADLELQKRKTNDAAKSSAAGPSKRVAEDGEAGKSGKIIGKRPKKKLKTIEDEETEGCAPEECMQDPLEMIDIEEPTIKEEVYGNEEFGEMNHGDVLESEAQGKRHFETIYCTPIIKEEMADDIEAPSSCHATDTDIIVPDFMKTVIKTEPVEVDEDEEDDNEELRKPRGNLPLMWRCPLVSCPEMFSAELDMYQHLNLSHVVKGLELLSKSKKASGPRSTVTQDLPNKPTEIPPSTSPAVAISGASGLMFFTSASPPSVPPVTVSSVTTPVVTSHVSTVTTPVVTSHSVPSSSSGPVTVTTTFSYSSITPSSASLVTTMSSSSVSSVTSATIIIAATPSVQAISSSTSSPLASSTELVSTSTQDCSVAPNIVATNHSSPQPPSQVSPLSASGGLKKFIVAPVSDQTSISTGPKQFLLLPSHPQQPQQNTASKPSEPLHIFQPSDLTTEDLPPCATDESEMFSISLARFPLNRRVPIKRKLIEVVDCIKKKNVSPDKLFIAYCENPDSRSV